uniref:Uncharacterized protein n=1 Tax=viral metagenome TaxID=1070528 RepID=A0A6C0J024_9ZZZZ
MTEKIEIDGEYFDIEDEELNNIEYLEILSIDEIIKDNPSFMAFSKDEIQSELYKMFKNKNKSDNFTNLFYDVLKNNREKEGKLDDYTNYIFIADADKKDYSLLSEEEEAKNFNDLDNLNTIRYNISKNNYFFAIEYDEKSSYNKFKPTSKTILELNDKMYYPVFPIDDVNVPIIAAYYKVPTATITDYMYVKVLSHLFNNKNINKKSSSRFTNINKLIKNTRPSIQTIINDIPDSFDLDYNNLNNFLNRYGYSMDFINKKDFDILYDYMNKLIKNEKERKNVYKPIKNKKIDIINNKLTFFDKLSKTFNLLNLTDKTRDLLVSLKIALDDKRINSNLLQKPKLLYDNIDDIVTNISNDTISIEQIIENIKAVKDFENIDKNINTIAIYLEIKDNLKEILEDFENIKADFEYSKHNIKNYDDNINEKLFVNIYNEMKEIILGNNEEDYEGLPITLRNMEIDTFEELEFDNEYVDEGENTIDISDNTLINKYLEKYWLTLAYKNDVGFIEILKIVLPIFYRISKIAGIEIDYELLSSELYIYFRGASTKYNIINSIFIEKQINIDYETINNIAKIKPVNIHLIDLNMGSEINNLIKNANKEYSDIINDVLNSSIAWWIMDIQSKIVNDGLDIDNNKLNPVYIEKWFLYGEPLYKEKTVNGVAPYLVNIMKDYIEDKNDYNNVIIYNDIIELINDRYSDLLDNLKKKYTDKISKKKIEYGIIAQEKLIENYKNKKFDKISFDYIDALLYSPGVNYKKIHKYLLGCCLQKLTKDFKPDSDFVNNSRNDLIQFKKQFAKRKETNKDRLIRYIPIIIDTKKTYDIEEDKEDNYIKYIKKIDSITKIESQDVIKWLDNMKTKNALLPDDIIDSFKNNTRSALDYIKKYIEILEKTAKKSGDLLTLFVPSKIYYKTLLLNIIKVLNNKTDDENTDLLLKKAIESIREILVDLNILNKVKTEDNRVDIDRINAYVVARALCLPCNPENTTGNILIPIIEVKTNFIEENAGKLYSKVLNSIKNSKFLSFEENTAFINTMRERNKQVKLSILNNKSVEENNLISALKKAGIKNNLMSVEKVVELQKQQYDNEDIEEIMDDEIGNDNEADIHFRELEEEELKQQDEIYEGDEVEEGENEYAMGQDEDNDDDILDRDDMGFIYAD